MLSEDKTQGKEGCDASAQHLKQTMFGFSLLPPCKEHLQPQLCLRLQLSQSVYHTHSPPFHQMHTTFLTDAASKT